MTNSVLILIAPSALADRDNGRWIHELELVLGENRSFERTIDAAAGQGLEIERMKESRR